MNDNWNHIRKIADSIGSDLDAEAAWDRFEQRPERRKRRSLFWWSTGAVGVLALFLLLGFFFIKDHHQSLQEVVADESMIDTSLKNKTTLDVKLDKEKKLDQIALQQRQNPHLEFNETQSQFQSKLKAKLKSKAKPLTDQVLVEKSNTTSIYQAQAQQEVNESLVQNSTVELGQTHNTSATETALSDSTSFILEMANDLSTQQADAVETNSMKQKDMTKNMGSYPIEQTVQDSYSAVFHKPDHTSPITIDIGIDSKITQSKTSISTIPLPISTNLHFASTILQIEDYIQLDNQLSNTKHLFSKSWTVQARHIYGIASRTLTGDDELFNNRRSAQEDLKELNATELLITRQLTPLFSISSGLSVGQYRVKLFEVNQDVIQNVVFEDVLLERLFKGGEIEERRGRFVGSQTITTERTRFQQYQDISVPVYANLHIKITPKLNLMMSTGASISLVNMTKGVTFESTISAGTYQSLDQLNYRSIGLIQGLANLSLSIQLNQKLDIQLGGHLRQDFTNRFKQSEASTDRFNSYGVMLGIQRRF